MLNVSDAMLDFLMNRTEAQPVVKVVFDNTTDEPISGLEAVDTDISEFITNFGNVSKELQLQDGVYRPGSHSFDMANTNDAGDFLFTLRKNIGLNSWINKTYRLLYGYRGIVAFTGIDTQDSYATGTTIQDVYEGLGPQIQDVYSNGAATSDEMITLFRGIVSGKTENRIDDVVSVSSADVLKYLSDYKFCNPAMFDSSLNALGFTNNRMLQPVMKYGTFNLVDTKDSSSFCAVSAIGNDTAIGAYAINYTWLFPIENLCVLNDVYWWNYITSEWEVLPTAVHSYGLCGVKNYYTANITAASTNLRSDANSSWINYLAGTGYFANSSPVVKVCASVIPLATNPISIILNILYLAGISLGKIDASANPISTVISGYSFDYAYQWFLNSGLKLNVEYLSQVSALAIIQQIGKLCAFTVFASADYSTTERRNLKIAIDKYVNPCKEKPALPTLSTNDNITSFTVEMNNDEIYSGVTVLNFDSAVSNKDSFDVCTKNTTTDLLTGTNLQQRGTKNVYLYDSHIQGVSLVENLYNAFKAPVERYSVGSDKIAALLEIGDYVNIYDHKISETVVARINNIQFDCWNTAALILKRYSRLYGPDPTTPTKVWAFCDCAKTDEVYYTE